MRPDQRPEEDPPPSPFVPSEDWIDALEEQCTEGMIQGARRYVGRCTHGVGYVNDTDYAGDLVQDALTDTACGVLQWDPRTKTLQQHIHDVIRMRTNWDRKRARRFPHESLDVLTADGEPEILAEADAALLERTHDASNDPAALATEYLAKLRQLATDDPTVLRLLDAFARGATSKADVMRFAGLSAVAYGNARRRLRRLVAQISSRSSRIGTLPPPKETEHAAH
jgi:hypothetical protein